MAAHRIINLTNLALTFKISELGHENSPERRKISIKSMNAEPQIVPVKLPGNRPLFAGSARSAANVVEAVSLIIIILLIQGCRPDEKNSKFNAVTTTRVPLNFT